MALDRQAIAREGSGGPAIITMALDKDGGGSS
jgi:hypothetical protein